MEKTIDWILTRLSEPSTWRGLAAMSMALGITMTPDLQNAIMAVGLSVIGLINVVKKDVKDEKPNSTTKS